MRYAKIRKMDITNGPGIGVSIFFQGCRFHCQGCFNKETWDFSGGSLLTADIINSFISIANNEHIKRISILGGEPLAQPCDEFLDFIKRLKRETNKPIYLWTGYEFNEIPEQYRKILYYIDFIITGRFIEELKDYNPMYGSSNQKVIDVKHTLENRKIVLAE